MKVRDIMTSPVISVTPDSTVLEAVRIMLQRHISGLPVIEKSGELVGIVTEGDFLRRAETGTQRRRPRWLEYLVGPGRLADEYTRSHGRKVYEIMTFGALTVTEDTPLDEVVRLMEKRRIKRLPVVRGTAVVGIVSRANLVHALAGLAREVKTGCGQRPGHPRPDRRRTGRSIVGADGTHQRHRQGRRGGTVGGDHRRARARGHHRRRGECAGCEGRQRPSGLGRADVWHGILPIG